MSEGLGPSDSLIYCLTTQTARPSEAVIFSRRLFAGAGAGDEAYDAATIPLVAPLEAGALEAVVSVALVRPIRPAAPCIAHWLVGALPIVK